MSIAALTACSQSTKLQKEQDEVSAAMLESAELKKEVVENPAPLTSTQEEMAKRNYWKKHCQIVGFRERNPTIYLYLPFIYGLSAYVFIMRKPEK